MSLFRRQAWWKQRIAICVLWSPRRKRLWAPLVFSLGTLLRLIRREMWRPVVGGTMRRQWEIYLRMILGRFGTTMHIADFVPSTCRSGHYGPLARTVLLQGWEIIIVQALFWLGKLNEPLLSGRGIGAKRETG